jgi:hypothetical protein
MPTAKFLRAILAKKGPALNEEAGVDQVLCYLNFGYLPQKSVLKSIELLGTYVIPELRKRDARRAASSLATSIRREGSQS